MRLLFTSLACLISVSVFGQGWEQTYGGGEYDAGYSVQQTTDGGFIIAGETSSFGNRGTDIYLIKTDNTGAEQWSQTFGGSSMDYGFSVQKTSDGGFILTGVLSGSLCLIKTDENGNEEWIQTYSGDRGYSVQQTTDGGYIIAGVIASETTGVAYDIYLLKTNQNGVAEWSQTYEGDGTMWGSSVQQTTDGGYIIAGSSNLSGYQGYLIKTDSNGIEQWSEFYYGEINEIVDDDNLHLYNVQQTFDGGYIIAGNTLQQEEIMTGTYPNDAIIIKTDENGVEEWRKTYGGIYADGFNAIKQTTDGGYISVGVTYSLDDVFLLYLLKTDENGNEEWIQTYEGLQAAFGTDISLTFDGGYIITGFTASDTTNSKVYLIKTDSEGTLSSSFTIPTLSPKKLEKVVDALGREVNHTTNQILFYIYDDGSVEKKFIVE